MTMASDYKNGKQTLPDKVLLFKKGDFYRAFDNDAHTVRRLTGLPFKGFGSRTADTYVLIPADDLGRYLAAILGGGYGVVLCDNGRMEEVLKQENLPGIPAPAVGTGQVEPNAESAYTDGRQEDLFGRTRI